MVDRLKTNLSSYVTGATAANAIAGIALVVPQTGRSGAATTKGYQPRADQTDKNTGFFNFSSLPDPLIFHYEGENSATFESDITDHFVENNSSVVDQIGLRPETVNVSGFIGELNNVLPLALQGLQTIANTLLVVDAYQPKLGITALQKLNQATLVYESAMSIKNSAVGAWSSLVGTSNTSVGGLGGVSTVGTGVQNKQQDMFQQFYGYWSTRTLFNVQTPWAIFENMAIKTLRAIQDAETRMITNFEVTFKRIRTAETKTTLVSSQSIGRALTQSSVLSDNGTTSGIPGASLASNLGAIA